MTKHFVSVLAVAGGLTLLPACKTPVFPVIDGIANVVAQDLAAGKSDAQIASDVCQFLGGTSQQDAVCANVETLIQDAVALLIDTGVLSAKQLENAKAWQAAHAKAAVGAK